MPINGTNQDDILDGTNSSDEINGLDGADYIIGYDGNDTINGGNGNDIVYAQTGDDRILAASGNDLANGGVGNDVIYGGAGNDTLEGDYGNDILLGDAGNDRIVGGFGSDFQSGGAGDDLIDSHGENVSNFVVEKDDLYGGLGKDTFRLRTDYLGGAASLNPLYDASYAIIRDFDRVQDTLDLRYDKNYGITYGNFLGGAARDSVISWKGNTVAVVQDLQITSADLG